jgi:hypothetical protein
MGVSTSDIMPVPSVFTAAFHRDFFLPLIVRSFGTKERGGHSGFEHHVPLELPVLFMVAVAAVVLGLPSWQPHGSIVGRVVALAGAAGALALFCTSVGSPSNRADLWAGFMVPVFCVCVFLGLTVGLFVGAVVWKTAWAKWAFGAAGLLGGYVTGIGAGLGMQWLGWVGRLLQGFAIPAIVGLVVLDIVLVVI